MWKKFPRRPRLSWEKCWEWRAKSNPARQYKTPDWRDERFEMRYVGEYFEVRHVGSEEWFGSAGEAGLQEAMRRANEFRWEGK